MSLPIRMERVPHEAELVQLRPTCQHMRHKLMYCDPRQATPGEVDDSSDTRVFLCSRSQEVLGPDGRPVGPKACHAGRACFCAPVGLQTPTTPARDPAADRA